ncbi:ATP-grasp domain-containing protein [Methanocaldococcus infernus]
MMKVLVVGVNTRPIANSLKRANYYVCSVSYYAPEDLLADEIYYFINKDRHGKFLENYREEFLTRKVNEIHEEFDYILIGSGVFERENSKVYDWDNVLGTEPKKIKELSYKPRIYRELKRLGYEVPEFRVAKNYNDLEKFLDEFDKAVVKPLSGSGGFIRKITSLDNLKNIKFPILIQELIEGKSFSANFINNIFICYNKQIIINGLYSGNRTPYPLNGEIWKKLLDIKEIFDIKGMWGVDFILKDNNVFILDINPRLLGTFETIEISSKTNLSRALINNLEVKPKNTVIKRIVFSKRRVRAKIKPCKFVFDIPKFGAIIEKGEPLATVIANRNLKSVIKKIYEWCI